MYLHVPGIQLLGLRRILLLCRKDIRRGCSTPTVIVDVGGLGTLIAHWHRFPVDLLHGCDCEGGV